MSQTDGRMEGDPERLRSVQDVCKPDRRSKTTSFLTNQSFTVQDQHDAAAKYILHSGVPHDIRIQFETTKNLYLYAWFVHRFYPVAKLHAYTCLEFSLRERFEAEVIAARSKPRKFDPSFKELLSYVVKNGYLKNEHFIVWRHRTEARAQQRTELERLAEMERLNLSEMVFDESDYEVTEEDRDHDYLETILESTPWLRNHYAHGSTSLDNQALGTIQLVSEIINQIFPEPQPLKIS